MLDNNTFTIKVAGRKAPTDMAAAKYLARCLDAKIKRRGNQIRAVLTFRCEVGRYEGVLLTCWLPIFEPLAAHHKFARAYGVAVGRELHVDEEISLQEFVGKLYVIEAGFRKTNGKNHQAEDPTKCKDERDFFRVHDIVSLADSATGANDISQEQVTTRPSRARRVATLSPRGGQGGDK
jgi:hypothetical protein